MRSGKTKMRSFLRSQTGVPPGIVLELSLCIFFTRGSLAFSLLKWVQRSGVGCINLRVVYRQRPKVLLHKGRQGVATFARGERGARGQRERGLGF